LFLLNEKFGLAVAGQPTVQIGRFTLMTFNAESHLKSFSPNSIHGLNLSMTLLTFDFLFNVSLMIKQNVFRKIEGFFPWCRRPRIKIFMFLSYPGVIGNDVLMTVKALFDRWDPRVNRPANIRVTELALNHLNTRMNAMAERDWLFGTDPGGRRYVKKIKKSQNQQHTEPGP